MCDVVGHDALWTGLVCSQLTKSLSLAELQPFGEDRSVGIAGCPCPIASEFMRILPLFLTYEPASVKMLRKPRQSSCDPHIEIWLPTLAGRLKSGLLNGRRGGRSGCNDSPAS